MDAVGNDVGREMLESRAGRTVPDVSLLLDKLGGLPLALVQAGAYIRARNLTAEKYIAHYEKTWDKLMAYQDRYPLQEYAERSVLTTWKMSYEQVRTVEPRAAMLLDQWAFLHPGEMSYELIEAYNDNGNDNSEHVVGEEEGDEAFVADELSFLDAVGVLAEYSLVNSTEETGRFSIHAVVHEWCLYNITDDETREQLCVRAIRMVAANIPPSTVAIGLQGAQSLLSHARLAARRHVKMERVTALHSELRQVADFMSDWESSQEVVNLYLRALRGKEEALGARHTSILDTVNNLGNLYRDQGKMKEAEEMYLRALRGFEEAWGAKHTSTLTTVGNLGNLYADQGKMKEAEEMYLRALRGFEEAWGAKHTSTLDTVNNLGLLYADQGKVKEAEEMYLRALRGFEEALGAKHTSTLDTVYGLGNLYRDRGDVAKAKAMYERAAEGYKHVEVDREAHIAYIRKQLLVLGGMNSKADRGCQAVDAQPAVSAADTTTRVSAIAVTDLADAPNMTGAAPARHRKRDFLLRVLKR